ncbi:beta-carotene hydroxylase [Pseudomonas sp. RP23018S]|uniref:beta-carotene hydroxylase n=1 Tax=Pseudomonas sp. RP23018S TaxID=3096037 RepID=UPI002ACABAED|nr:beta-carotene hydroxylase [Pseudomonas sp. RP23018S]MDZ5605440.1 beta-carotene hydroxylase [Pseudomonas sp. RP23018S]
MLYNLAVLFGTLLAMEGVGTLAHQYVMHGWGWWLHRSHHEPHLGMLELNDVYLLALALIAAGLVALGKAGHAPLQWVGGGVAGYGVLYVVLHDGLFHRHWPRAPRPLNRYLKRLHRAHRLHHALKGRTSVSFGFFYAPPLEVLKRQLRQRRAVSGQARTASGPRGEA